MADPTPLMDDELYALERDTLRFIGASVSDTRRLVATVEQARRERDAAQAPSVEIVQALMESENLVDRLTSERDAAQLAIIAARGAYFAGDWDDLERVLGCEPVGADVRPDQSVEVDAIRRAQTGEPDHD